MPPVTAATRVARSFWERATEHANTPTIVATRANAMFVQLRAGLARWIGDEGYRALLKRAATQIRDDHPAVTAFAFLGDDEAALTDAVLRLGVSSVSAGLIAQVAALIELLGRIVGEEMALHLVEQIVLPSPRGVVSNANEGSPDGEKAKREEAGDA